MLGKPNFLIVPYALLDCEDCHLTEYMVYAAIYWFEHMRGEKCIASNASIARIAKVSERSVMGALEKLETNGFIRRIYVGDSKARRSEIQCLVMFGKGEAQLTLDYDPLHPKGAAQLTRVVRVNNKRNITAAQESPQAFSAEETQRKWREGTDRAFKVLCWFFEKKHLWAKFDSQQKVQHAASRHLRAARRIATAGWSAKDLSRAIGKMPDKMESEWTLETAEKYLTK